MIFQKLEVNYFDMKKALDIEFGEEDDRKTYLQIKPFEELKKFLMNKAGEPVTQHAT